MKIIKSPLKMQNELKLLKIKKKSIGFVPTMGALHDGHLSLIKKARKENNIVVVSIFVNPTQFGPNEDYKSYPRNFNSDVIKCKEIGVDFIFYPDAKAMYPENYLTFVEVKKLSTDYLCGKFRPGHFKGVSTIVLKLFNIVQPDIGYFGLKDYQQYIIIKKMVKDLNLPIKIKGLPIVREKDGLAMSSRNKYLSPAERNDALLLSKSLLFAKKLIKNGIKSSKKIKNEILKILLTGNNIKKENIDYISIVDPESLEDVKKIEQKVVIAVAVKIGKARLIDNIMVKI